MFLPIYSVLLVGAICILSDGGKMRTLGLGCVIGDGTGVFFFFFFFFYPFHLVSPVLLRPLDMLSVMVHLLIRRVLWVKSGAEWVVSRV